MEHLSLPHGEELSAADEVRFVSTELYDEGPFQEYAQRNPRLEGINDFIDDLRPLPGVKSYFSRNAKLLEDLLQTWLFFGLLHEFFGAKARRETFVHSERKTINTSKLVSVTREWYPKAQATSESARHKLADCLSLTYDLLYLTLGTDFDENIRFSIASSAEILDRALQQAFPKETTLGITWSLGFWNESRALGMKQIGWCPYEASHLQTKKLSLCTLYYLSRMRKADTNRDHSKCASDLCLFAERAKSDLAYPASPLHRTKDCNCQDIGLSQADKNSLVGLLDRGIVPLVKIDLDENETPVLTLSDSSANSRYVAISYVFADGLGNQSNNSLHSCQLKYLRHVISSLDEKINDVGVGVGGGGGNQLLLWIDTLCVPLSPKEARSNALTLMRQTYKRANHVLILDEEMENLQVDQMPVLEQSARLLTSTWMRRLWTLHEGILARNLWVQFAGGAVHIQKVHRNLQFFYENIVIDRRAVFRDLLARFQWLREQLADSKNITIELIAEAMENRTLSYPGDESLCIAALLDFDIGAIYNIPPKERMRALWNLLAAQKKGLPKSIIFHESEALPFPGYRWAPSTLLDLRSGLPSSLHWPDGIGIPISSGLLVHFPGANISACHPPEGMDVTQIGLSNPKMIWTAPGGMKFENIFVRDSFGGWSHLLSPRIAMKSTNQDTSKHGSRSSSTSSIGAAPYLYEMLQHKSKQYAIILRENTRPGGKKGNQEGTSDGILVEVIHEEEDTTLVRKMRSVRLEHQDPSMCTRLELAVAASQSIVNSEEVRNYASALSSGAGLRRETFDGLRRAIDGALRNKPYAETPADRKKMAGMAFQALLGRYAILQPWSEPTKAWAVD